VDRFRYEDLIAVPVRHAEFQEPSISGLFPGEPVCGLSFASRFGAVLLRRVYEQSFEVKEVKLKRELAALAFVGIVFASGPLAADGSGLAAPIVELMPHVKQLMTELNLNAEQVATLDSWLADAPAKRKALEAEAAAVREQLREAILNGESRLKREQLKNALAAKETRLIEMRSLCTRMLRNTLTPEQFDRVVAQYRASS
jgi:hypothetical protein